ncbi:MAG: hypothetical protein LUQ49_04045 [Methanomicrobiales archaeon]|nr:hypothetical protein [Methanomicrobiales archaeon]
MEGRSRKIGIAAGAIIVLVAVYQFVWPYFYPSLVNLNRYPTAEYFRIMWLLSPNGLSVITIILGCVFIAWVAYTER